MLLKGIHEENGWMLADYHATWKYGYDFMLDAAQTVVDTDFGENLQRVAVGTLTGGRQEECMDEVRKAKRVLRDSPKLLEEHGLLIVSGISKLMECPIQLMFYNQTDRILLCTPFKRLFDEYGNDVFTTYMCSIEIRAYCTNTKRRVENSIRQKK